MPNYVTTADFDLYISNELGTTEANLRLAALKAAERAVDEYCQRSFAVAGNASARTYVPTGSQLVRIHDCTTVTSVTLDGASIDPTYYQLEPTTVSWSGQQRPYEQIRYLNGFWMGLTPGKAAVSVTATWGWAAVPDDVVEATLIIGKDICQQRRTVGNLAIAGDIGTTVRLNTYVRQLLAPLRRAEAFGMA